MKTRQILLLFFFLFGLNKANAITYYTLSSGSWNNTTVWSLDGTNGCACVPSTTLSGFTVVITKPISLSSHLQINSGGSLLVQNSGGLQGTAFNLTVNSGGIVSNYSSLNLNRLTVNEGGVANLTATQTIQDRMEISGTLNISGFTSVLSGNINILATGVMNLLANTGLELFGGNIYNSGIINLGTGSCLSLNVGNVKNNSTGTINGTGFIQTLSGNIQNENVWSSTVEWCAAGSSSGMPTSSTCSIVASSACNVVLPLIIHRFEAKLMGEELMVEWENSKPEEVLYYELEKTKDVGLWEVVAKTEANVAVDENVYNGISYYRLKQTAKDASSSYSPIIAINNTGNTSVELFPNPATNTLYLEGINSLAEPTVYILSAIGEKVMTLECDEPIEALDISLLPAGIYFLSYTTDAGSNRKSKRFIKF